MKPMITAKKMLAASSLLSLIVLSACSGGSGNSSVADSGNNTAAAAVSSSTEEVTVSLSVMTADRFLQLAEQKFEEQHPNIDIEIKEYEAAPSAEGNGKMMMTKMPDPQTTEKYASSVGAELMSGKASDIIVMNGLPAAKYADKNLLADLGEMMKNDASFPMDHYYTDIFEAMKYNGVLYTVPAKVELNLWLGDKSVIDGSNVDDNAWSWADFKNAAQTWLKDDNGDGQSDRYPLGKIEPVQLMTLMLNSSFSNFVDTAGKRASFDSQEFTGMLELAKSFYDEQIIYTDGADNANVVIQPKAKTMGYMDMYMMPKMSSFEESAAYYNLPSENEQRGTQFTSSMPLAINSKSEHTEEAWEFVKFLLSDEMQSANELNGIAVNKNGAKAQEENLKNLGQNQGNGGQGGGKKLMLNINGKTADMEPATDADIALIEEVLNRPKVYAETDPKIAAIVTEETAPFFQGQRSAEETAKIIQNKVGTYLLE